MPGDASENTHCKRLAKNPGSIMGGRPGIEDRGSLVSLKWSFKIYGNLPEGMLTGLTGLLDTA